MSSQTREGSWQCSKTKNFTLRKQDTFQCPGRKAGLSQNKNSDSNGKPLTLVMYHFPAVNRTVPQLHVPDLPFWWYPSLLSLKKQDTQDTRLLKATTGFRERGDDSAFSNKDHSALGRPLAHPAIMKLQKATGWGCSPCLEDTTGSAGSPRHQSLSPFYFTT